METFPAMEAGVIIRALAGAGVAFLIGAFVAVVCFATVTRLPKGRLVMPAEPAGA